MSVKVIPLKPAKPPINVELDIWIYIDGKPFAATYVMESDEDGIFDLRELRKMAVWMAMLSGITLWKNAPDQLKEMPWELREPVETNRLFLCENSPFYALEEDKGEIQ